MPIKSSKPEYFLNCAIKGFLTMSVAKLERLAQSTARNNHIGNFTFSKKYGGLRELMNECAHLYIFDHQKY